jgi:hypothetical protein
LLLSERIRRNSCLQTTCSILVSKLFLQVCTPMEPNIRSNAWVLPGIICFFLVLYSTLCAAVRHVLLLESLRVQWDQIVPFIIIFSTMSILRSLKENAELRFLYVAICCHLLWWSSLDSLLHLESVFPLLTQFVDSIMARGILLILDDLVFGTTVRPGIGLCFSFMCWLTILCIFFPREKRSRQCETCVGVLSYSLCIRLVHALKLLCKDNIGVTFAVVLALIVLLLYFYQLEQGSLHFFEYTPLCSNALSILWGRVLDNWVFSLYQEWEQILMYMIIFWGMQSLKDAITSVLQKSETPPTPSVLLAQKEKSDKEAMLIANESSAQLPHVS